MDISFFLAQYLQFRYPGSSKLELYVIDQVNAEKFEIIVRDDGKPLSEEEIGKADQIIASLSLNSSQKRHQYFHKGYNHLQIELTIGKKLIPELGNFHSLLSLLVLENPNTQFVFSYLSPKGEYVLDSTVIHENFSSEELQSKELLQYVNELLQDHFQAVRYTY